MHSVFRFLRNNIRLDSFVVSLKSVRCADSHQTMCVHQASHIVLPYAEDLDNWPPPKSAQKLSPIIRASEPWLPRRRRSINNKSLGEILTECGLYNVTDSQCNYYVDIMCSTVEYLKERHYIPREVNVAKHIIGQIKDIKLSYDQNEFSDAMRLGTIRYFILTAYINQLLGTDNHLFLLKETNSRILSQSLADINECYQLLTKDIGFTPEKICTNCHVLGADRKNVQQFLNLEIVGGVDVRYLALKQPVLLSRNNIHIIIKEIMEHLRTFHINESNIKRFPNIFLLTSQKVLERLTEISEHEELRLFLKHPRALFMVTAFNRIMARMESLKSFPMRKRLTFNALMQPDDEVFIR